MTDARRHQGAPISIRRAAGEARTDALIHGFELDRGAVGGDDDLPGAIDQRIHRVAKFLLDLLAVQELHIINHEEIDGPERFLEGESPTGSAATARSDT